MGAMVTVRAQDLSYEVVLSAFCHFYGAGGQHAPTVYKIANHFLLIDAYL